MDFGLIERNFDPIELNIDLVELNFDLLKLNFDLFEWNFDLIERNLDLLKMNFGLIECNLVGLKMRLNLTSFAKNLSSNEALSINCNYDEQQIAFGFQQCSRCQPPFQLGETFSSIYSLFYQVLRSSCCRGADFSSGKLSERHLCS